jgi:transposase
MRYGPGRRATDTRFQQVSALQTYYTYQVQGETVIFHYDEEEHHVHKNVQEVSHQLQVEDVQTLEESAHKESHTFLEYGPK